MPSGYKKDGTYAGIPFAKGHGLIGSGATGKRWKWTEEQKKQKMGKPSGAKGKHWKLSEETKKKMSQNNARTMLGKKHSEETKQKIRDSAWRGEKNHMWKGGISFEPYSTDWTRSLRISIRERDKYTCVVCGEKQGDRAFDVHHVDYDKKNCNPSNLVTLCLVCHRKTNHNRDYWLNYFQNI